MKLARAPALVDLADVVVTPSEGEFVEIHNPTPAAIDLSDVYLTDATFAGGGTYYSNLPTGTNAGGGAALPTSSPGSWPAPRSVQATRRSR